MSIPVIDTLKSLGNYPVVNSNDVGCGNSNLDTVLSEKYVKPSNGIPKTDLSSEIIASLSKADTAVQSQDISNKADISYVNESLESKANKSTVSTISSRVDSVETQQTTLSERMDTFTSLEDGSTTGDAELTDIRVAENGTTYTSAGASVRGQISSVKSDINIISNSLLSGNLDDGDYSKGHWDWLGNDDIYINPSDDYICERKKFSVKSGDLLYVKKPDSITGDLVILFNNKKVASTSNKEMYAVVPEGSTVFSVYVVSNLPISSFTGFVIKKQSNSDIEEVKTSLNGKTDKTETAEIRSVLNTVTNHVSNKVSDNLYAKGYIDFLPDGSLYFLPDNSWIADKNIHDCKPGDIIYVKKPESITSRIVVVFNGKKSSASNSSELVTIVPDGATKFGVYANAPSVSVESFEGFNIKISEDMDIAGGFEKSIAKGYSVKDDTAEIIVVDKNGSGDYATISAAYVEANKRATYLHEIEIVVHPGVYYEYNLIPPKFTHTHGLMPNTVIVTSEGHSDTLPVFDQRENTKLSNMTIISHTGYCIHYDVTLDGKVVHNENLYLKKVASTDTTDIIGGGGFSYGALFEWIGCTFENGYVNCHTNPANYQNTKLVFRNCILSDAIIRLGNVGGFGHYICEIDNLITTPGKLSLTSWTANQRTVGADKVFANSCEWQIIGGGNVNFRPVMNSTGSGLVFRTKDLNKNIIVGGTALNDIFGYINYRKGFSRQYGRAYGSLHVNDAAIYSGTDMCKLWHRLGDCSTVNKTINVTIDGVTENFTFTKNYLNSKDSEESIINAINNVIKIAVLEKYTNTDSFENINVTDKRRMIVKSASGIKKGEFVGNSGYLSFENASKDNVLGVALEDGAQGESIMIWVNNIVPVSGYSDGVYGMGANGILSASATNKIGEVSGNYLFRYGF